jgi:lipopolysaccharide/colanic/teichoic acid biosynthesis glycosyltransferase
MVVLRVKHHDDHLFSGASGNGNRANASPRRGPALPSQRQAPPHEGRAHDRSRHAGSPLARLPRRGGPLDAAVHGTLLEPAGLDERRLARKHAVERVVAALALLALAPLLVAIALAVALTSSGPVLYRQRRIGRHGERFDILKFRSMRAPQADVDFTPAPGTAPGGVEGEDRRTPVGRLLRETSLDELPQLINVVRGEMSLVGPRPERPEFADLFADELPHYHGRHAVRAGITGLAQVRGLRGQTSIARRLEADLEYVATWSPWLDVQILGATVVGLVRRR